ncbi:Prostaglandin reductase 3 [Blyttiomyces sp. JEL0837]|nr:Prostaglandin reductase 3 [Blyttiomyces sp. JEL0837]
MPAAQVVSNLPSTYQKWVVHKLSNKFEEAARLETVSTEKLIEGLKPTQVIIRNHYLAINASDTNFTAGRYDPRVQPPFDCGFEGLGEIVALGATAAKKFQLGQPVATMSYGAFTELQAIDAALVIPHHGRMKSGETVLVTAAAGGAGQVAVQLAKMAGNHVIGTCSSDDKAEVLKSLGCDRVVNYKKEKLGDVLKKEYRKGVNIVFESVGGDMLKDCLNNLAVKGRCIIIGAISTYGNDVTDGPMNSFKGVWKDQVPTVDLLQKSSTVTGFFLNHYTRESPAALANLMKAVESGKLKPLLESANFSSIKDVPAAIHALHKKLRVIQNPKSAMTKNIREILNDIVEDNPNMSLPVAAVKALAESIKSQKATTMSEFMETLTHASNTLKSSSPRNFSIIAGCESFLKFLNDTSHDVGNLDSCKQRITELAENFIFNAPTYPQRIAKLGAGLIKDDAVILLHSYSRVVMMLLEHAASLNRRFKVIVTESLPSKNGFTTAEQLRKKNIPVCMIPDSAVGLVIEKVDMVLVGAEGVVENGGLINQIGTYQIAIVAKAAKKPFYAVTESYKFVRFYPLNQSELDGPSLTFTTSEESSNPLSSESNVDYTPPQYVTSLITNLGVLTPDGVVQFLLN